MAKTNWKKKLPAGDAFRRASGRRRYNAERAREAWLRRFKLIRLLSMRGMLDHGQQKEIAAALGVSRSTLCRDYAIAKGITSGMIGGGVPPVCRLVNDSSPVVSWTFCG